ncbi:MAG: hypothetical protein RL211_1845 [Pseudomonadota bacterium]|jgi:hypothetical protein
MLSPFSPTLSAVRVLAAGLLCLSCVIGCGGGTEETGGLSANAATTTSSAPTAPPSSNSTVNAAPVTPIVVTGGGQVSGCTSTGATGAIAVSNVPSRYSGVAPLAVFFDASATTASGVARPFHNLEYRWNFADTASGNWAYGSKAGTASRNAASGPVASHVFETPGTYRVGITVTDGTNTVSNQCVEIAVQDPNVEFTNSKTVCISRSGSFAGCPSGATQVTSSDADASYAASVGTGNKRILYRRGETFDASATIRITTAGPGLIGAYGTGAKPVFSRTAGVTMINVSSPTTPTVVSDWRLQDIVLEGNSFANAGISGEGSFSRLLLHRVDIRNISYGFTLSQSILDGLNAAVPFTHALWDEVYIVDSSIFNLIGSSGPCGIYASARRIVAMGNNVNNSGGGEHGIRTQFTDRAVFSSNTIEGIAVGKANFSIRGGAFGGTTTLAAGQYSEKIVVSDNRWVGGASGGIAGVGPQNSYNDERGRNMIWERNLYLGTSATVNFQTVAQPDMTFRNNVFVMQGGLAVKVEKSGLTPVPTNVHFYNNSMYSSGSGQFIGIVYAGNPADGHGGATITAMNNLAYAPSSTAISRMTDNPYSGATITASNNSTVAQIIGASPSFTTTPPTTAAHFKPLSGSYAIGGATRIAVLSDFFGVTTPASPDMGAVVR